MDKINQISDMYRSGELNYLILGAIRVTLEDLGYNKREVADVISACRRGTFDLFDAEELMLRGYEG